MENKTPYLKIHHELECSFINFFESNGYQRLAPVPISSHVDRSVYLINSATNLFKPYFSSNHCVFAIQHCMRTQTLSDYYNEERESQYPTTFDSYGAFVPASLLCKILKDTIELFSSIGFEFSKMRMRISCNDIVLLSAVSQSLPSIRVELDERSEKYDHKYGDGITGRAIKLDYYQEWQKKYKNLCYFILIYLGSSPVGVELATSDQLIIMRSQNKKYGISVSKIADILPMSVFGERRFADSVVGAAHLLYEGLKPNSSTTNGRTLKKYIAALQYFSKLLGRSENEVISIVLKYITMEYGEVPEYKKLYISELLAKWIAVYRAK